MQNFQEKQVMLQYTMYIFNWVDKNPKQVLASPIVAAFAF